jgi:hypothetical protein
MNKYYSLTHCFVLLAGFLFSVLALAENNEPTCPSVSTLQNTIWLDGEFIELEKQHLECGASGHCWPVDGRWELRASSKFNTDRTWDLLIYQVTANNMQQALQTIKSKLQNIHPASAYYYSMGYWFCEYGNKVQATTLAFNKG